MMSPNSYDIVIWRRSTIVEIGDAFADKAGTHAFTLEGLRVLCREEQPGRHERQAPPALVSLHHGQHPHATGYS